MIEMKSSVGYKTWQDTIKPKVRTSYLTALAIADFLGIHVLDAIAYTTYENDRFDSIEQAANPRAMMPRLGVAARNALTDEWENAQMFLNLGEEMRIPHRKIQMRRNGTTGILEGELVIE